MWSKLWLLKLKTNFVGLVSFWSVKMSKYWVRAENNRCNYSWQFTVDVISLINHTGQHRDLFTYKNIKWTSFTRIRRRLIRRLPGCLLQMLVWFTSSLQLLHVQYVFKGTGSLFSPPLVVQTRSSTSSSSFASWAPWRWGLLSRQTSSPRPWGRSWQPEPSTTSSGWPNHTCWSPVTASSMNVMRSHPLGTTNVHIKFRKQ